MTVFRTVLRLENLQAGAQGCEREDGALKTRRLDVAFQPCNKLIVGKGGDCFELSARN
jgi:hypothetical protein